MIRKTTEDSNSKETVFGRNARTIEIDENKVRVAESFKNKRSH
jgi:hypothetical protein